jgi:xanthine/CO dehydrogenase XdhC/CoxF family maturation factor
MNELHAILDVWRNADLAQGAVLATVVHVTGSAYRRPGARMLILNDGRHIGGVSGGCLEGDLIRKAWWLTNSETPVVRVYDTTSDDDVLFEFGLGCNGIVHVLLERASSPGAARMLEFLETHRLSRRPALIATVVHSNGRGIPLGHRLMMDESLVPAGELVGSRIEGALLDHVSSVFAGQASCLVHLPEADVFMEFVAPPLPLVIFGAGHDAVPLVNIAASLGWSTTVADGRPAYARPERFPVANRVLTIKRDDLLGGIDIDEETAVVVMTHNFPMDLQLMPLVLAHRPRYVGLLGPRSRAEKLFGQLGQAIPSVVHAPAGLDIGCDTPQAIALSIAADIQASISRRGGRRLMLRSGAIHAPAAEIGVPTHKGELDPARPAYCATIGGSNV